MANINVEMTSADGITLATEGKYCQGNITVAPDSTSKANLIAENIKVGTTILGVTGTLSPEIASHGTPLDPSALQTAIYLNTAITSVQWDSITSNLENAGGQVVYDSTYTNTILTNVWLVYCCQSSITGEIFVLYIQKRNTSSSVVYDLHLSIFDSNNTLQSDRIIYLPGCMREMADSDMDVGEYVFRIDNSSGRYNTPLTYWGGASVGGMNSVLMDLISATPIAG